MKAKLFKNDQIFTRKNLGKQKPGAPDRNLLQWGLIQPCTERQAICIQSKYTLSSITLMTLLPSNKRASEHSWLIVLFSARILSQSDCSIFICIISVINDLSNEENRNTTLLNLQVTGFDKAPWNAYKCSASFTVWKSEIRKITTYV